MGFASTFPFFTHVEVDGLDGVSVEDIEVLRLPAPQHLHYLEQLRRQFLDRWRAGDDIGDVLQRVFDVPADFFMPLHPPRYIVGYHVHCARQARIFAQIMRDLDRYIAVLSQFALRVRVLSATQPIPDHPDGYRDLSSVLRAVRYLGEGLWSRALRDFERQRGRCWCWRYLPDSLIAEGAVPEHLADALDLLLYKAQIVRILASEPLQEVRCAVEEGATEYVRALHAMVLAQIRSQRRRWLHRRTPCSRGARRRRQHFRTSGTP